MGEILFSLQQYKMMKEKEETIATIQQQRQHRYQSDFYLFQEFCQLHNLECTFDSLELYLHALITEKKIRLSTFNRRLAAVKYWLIHVYQCPFTSVNDKNIKLLRSLYDQAEYIHLKPMYGKRAEKQSEVLRLIDRYDTDKQSDIRKRAICLVNLITANRPSEMVRLRVRDFNLENHTVQVMLVKQGEMKEKRLTLECVQAVKRYIKVCGLLIDDFFVGAADKWGNHTSRQISEVSYNQAIHSWMGFAPYTFRKTQITAMYQKGADIPTIVKQSGHKSHQTVMNHYIKLRSEDVDEYL